MKEKLCKFLRPRLAVLLAAALLAAYLPVMPAARAADGAPADAWEEQPEVKDKRFAESGTTLDSYTYSKSDGTTETVTVDHSKSLGSEENPISIPNEEALILFGEQMNNATSRKYYILDKPDRVYDMGEHTMRSLMGDIPDETGMPDPGGPFQGVLIGNGARIENVCINIDGESDAFGLFGTIGGAEIADLTVSLPSASAGSSAIFAGGLVGHVDGTATLTNCTAKVTGSLTAVKFVGGLVGRVDGTITLRDCTAMVGSLTTPDNGSRTGVGGLVGYVDGTATLTKCAAKVSGSLTAVNDGDHAGGLVGLGSNMTLTNCTATVGSLTVNGYAGGGLVGCVDVGGTATLADCTAEVTGSLTAGSGGYAGGLGGDVDGTATLTDCAVQTVITKQGDGSYAPSGPVGDGNATFSGANVTTLQMGAGSSVYLALVNNTALTLADNSGGVLTATGNATGNGTTGSVTVGSNGNAEINVHGGANSGGATYTLTGVNGTIRLEDKTGDTPAEYWVTLDAGFTSTDPDPLARGDKVDLLGAAGNRRCTVTVQAGTGGSVTGGGPVSAGTEVTVTAIPSNGYRFVGWMEDGQQVSTEANYIFTVTSSRTLTAVFERTSSGGGSSGGGGGGTYTPPPKKDEPQTGSSGGWKDIQKELENTKPGDNVDVDMNGATEVPKEVLEGIAGKDVEVSFDMGGGIVWTVNGKDIPSGIGSLNLGIRTGSSSIPVSVFNAITGEKSTVQFTLAHSGPFGTVLHLSLNLGAANRGYWANLYWYDESSNELVFQHSCLIDGQGMASWPFDHASSYAVVIDDKNHDPAWENPFADVSEGDWYYEAVRFVQERGLMNGYEDGRFGPNDTLSRAQLAQILFNREGRPVVNYLLTFSDVAGEAWYTEAVRWAASQGIVSGYGDGTFGPNDPITREHLAVMLWRYSKSPAATSKELHFNDESEISGFALEAMRWAVENGILNGYGDGRLGPQGQSTRAQVAQMLKNFIENQEDDEIQ